MTCDLRAHITESRFFRHGYTTDEARRLFCHYRRLQRWLEVEAALAASQAELGIIPASAAAAIAEHARLDLLPLEAVEAGIRQTNHSLVPLLDAWQSVLPESAGRYIHYGATTQDIQDTAQVLELRDACRLIDRDVHRLLTALAELARQHAGTVMIGRTHNQPALPFTFGLKAAGWLDELLRHHERLQQVQQRLFVAQLFGGVGTMASFGDQGLAVLETFSRRLDLAAPACAWHASRDRLTEFAASLALLCGCLARMAGEIAQLSRFEIGELEEPFHHGKIGSSTMPHKRNPETCEQVVVLFRLVRSKAALATDLLTSEHERDYRAVRIEWAAITDAVLYTCGALALVNTIMDGLTVHADRLRANARQAAALLATETLMFRLGEHIGKQAAHALLYELAMRAVAEQRDFRTLLLDNSTVRRYFDEDSLTRIVEPDRYTGLADQLTRGVVQKAVAITRQPPPVTPPPCPLADGDGCRLATDTTS